MEPVSLSPIQTAEASAPADVVSTVGGDYKAFTPLYDKFGILNKESERVNRNLEVIWSWAKSKAETQDKESVLWQITKLNNRLGDSSNGSAPYTKVLAYISEYNRMVEAEKRLKELENNGRDY